MFTWATQAPFTSYPQHENLNIIRESFRLVLWARSTFGDFLSPLPRASLPTGGGPQQCAGACTFPAASMSQLFISRNSVSQVTSHWQPEISNGGSITSWKSAEASKQHTTARSSLRNPAPPCSLPRLLIPFLSHSTFSQVCGLSLLLSTSSDGKRSNKALPAIV